MKKIAAVILGALAFAAPAQAHHPTVTRLFSLAASRGVPAMPPMPRRPHYICTPTSLPPYEACCLWNQQARDGMGAWDCEIVLADRRAHVRR